MTDKKDKLLEEMVFQHNKQIADLKAELRDCDLKLKGEKMESVYRCECDSQLIIVCEREHTEMLGLKAENEKLKSQFNNSFMLDWAKRQQNKKWEKILNDCCKANAELVEQIADLNAENEKLKKLLKDCILQKR